MTLPEQPMSSLIRVVIGLGPSVLIAGFIQRTAQVSPRIRVSTNISISVGAYEGDRRYQIERRSRFTSASSLSSYVYWHSSGFAAASAHQWHGAAMVTVSSMIVA